MSMAARIASLARRDAPTTIGIGLTAAWLLLIALFWLLVPGGNESSGGIARLVGMVGAVLPLVLIWMAVMLASAIAALRAEAEELRERLGQLRDMAATRGAPPPRHRSHAETQPRSEPLFETVTPAPSQASHETTSTPASVSAPAAAIRPRQASDSRQSAMRFDGLEAVSVSPDTLIRALNFPDGPEDIGGVAALRAALKDYDNSRALRAAQDVITLLAAQDLYMDDQPAPPSAPDLWRNFAGGARGSAMTALGSVHDGNVLAVVSDLIRSDEIFRDAAHHFLRHFDNVLTRLVPQLDDTQITALAQTRSARAFMLLGRAAGIFG